MAVRIGVSLGPGRSSAVTVQDGTVLGQLAGSDPAKLLAEVARTGSTGLVIDVSRLLADHVLHRHEELSPVAMIRVLPRAATDPALGRHPDDVVERLVTRRYTVPGGHDLFGRELRPIDRGALRAVCQEIQDSPARDIAVVASGSPAQPRHEREVADALQAAMPDARISVAYEFGGQGLAAREATVVLNAALSGAGGRILDACERGARGTPFQIARGDGGWVSPSRFRTLPVLGIGAADALQLQGAASLAGAEDCRVLLDRVPEPMVGDVRNGLAAVRPQTVAELGTVLVVPTAALTRAGASRASDIALVKAERPADELTCVGAAVSRPMAWLDEIAFIESTAELEGIRRDAHARATAIATANGATPGSADVVEMSTVAVPYSPSGTVRVRVRVAGVAEEPGA
ncbi:MULTISPECIES: hydantoinase/oxoprolinase N-terminal domain-containing protein [Amycolatopsis]|uniref:Hydantoinase/oxoprolinase N-terminal region n=1 Tax=Amycolatopsis sacchari TaxID=115433 RepID=A0A1I3JIR5_9PSEU|nr:hydantoinase/oxoprolinase N-terminal domain-containing protein [Amycolatopsis sacchari]SFI60141.1 Hydantoinase/oxoprolinase N-terminal region [Amycolatopsis sacchari]